MIKRLTDEEMVYYLDEARSRRGIVNSVSCSNLVIVELLMRLLERERKE